MKLLMQHFFYLQINFYPQVPYKFFHQKFHPNLHHFYLLYIHYYKSILLLYFYHYFLTLYKLVLFVVNIFIILSYADSVKLYKVFKCKSFNPSIISLLRILVLSSICITSSSSFTSLLFSSLLIGFIIIIIIIFII